MIQKGYGLKKRSHVKNVLAILIILIFYSYSETLLSQIKQLAEPIWVKSDEICQLLNNCESSKTELSEEDSEKAKQAFQTGYDIFKQYLKNKDIQLLLQSQSFFETSLKIDCMNGTYQKAINGVYRLLENHYKKEENYNQAILIDERLIRLNSGNTKDFNLYFSLGNNYLKFNKLDYALENLKISEELLKKEIKKPEVVGDSLKAAHLKNQMYAILILQNKIYSDCHKINEALEVINRAQHFTTNEKQLKTVQALSGYFNRWNFWNDKEALDLQIEINKLMGQKQYVQVNELYKKLLSKFTDFCDNRRIEALILHTMFEFQFMNKKQEAIEQLLPYILINSDSVNHIQNINKLYDHFSSMCYIYGIEQLNLDRFAAYCYFKQGHAVPSEYQPKMALEILKLSSNDNSKTIEIGQKLWDNKELLNEAEKKILCEYLIHANKRLGDAESTKNYYNAFLNFQ